MRRVVIEDRLLLDMSRDPILVSEFPFLKPLAQLATENCAPCARKKAAKNRERYQAVKRALLSNPTAVARVKNIVSADRIVVFLADPSGKVTSTEA